MRIIVYTHLDDRPPEAMEYWMKRQAPTVGDIPYKVSLLCGDSLPSSPGLLVDTVFKENDTEHERKRVFMTAGDQLAVEFPDGVIDGAFVFMVTNLGDVDAIVSELFGEEPPGN